MGDTAHTLTHNGVGVQGCTWLGVAGVKVVEMVVVMMMFVLTPGAVWVADLLLFCSEGVRLVCRCQRFS